jgi:hypothetical protein
LAEFNSARIAGSTSLKKLGSRLGPKAKENRGISLERAEVTKAFSAQMTEFYWVLVAASLVLPLLVTPNGDARGAARANAV